MGDNNWKFQGSKEDQTQRISKSIFVTNFPEHFTAKDLWNVCIEYGIVIDVFIPFKKSQAGKRFAFVRFIKVENIDRLVMNLCTIWIGRLRLHANVLLARTRGEKLKVLEIDSCSGFSTDGLLYIGKYCTDLRILSLENSSICEKDGEWLHELALHNTSIESLNFYKACLTKLDVKDLALVAKNCSQSLVSVKISDHYEFTELVEFFSYLLKLEDFGGGFVKNYKPINQNHLGMGGFGVNPNIHFVMGPFGYIPFPAQQAKYNDFKFPPKLKYLALNYTGLKDIVLPFAHLITQLDTKFLYGMPCNYNHPYSLVEICPNLEVLYTTTCADGGLENLSKYCKNLRKLYVTSRTGYVTEKGLLALAQGCPKLECLHIYLSSITYDVMAYIGMQMKNLYDLSMVLLNKGVRKKNLVLDKGIRTLLIGCNKLERLSICFEELGGLSDESLKNIGMCGYNLRYLSLCYVGESDAGLVELSFGCPKLQTLVIKDCPFSKEAFDIFRCNVYSLRYFEVQGIPHHCRYLLEEDQPNFKQIV
ncbi:coronatine-insensitive protein 1-like protein [Tanacetum coccineum]